jgi:hypothetical protein
VPHLGPLASVLALALAGYAAWYLAVCIAAPFYRHRACHGTGRHLTRIRHRVTRCRRCRGTGRRVRLGRRAWTWLRAEHHAGTHPPAPKT